MDERPEGRSARAALADEVKARIERTGLGLERLAARLTSDGVPVSKSALSRYQRGEALPPRAVLIALASLAAADLRRTTSTEPVDDSLNGTSVTALLELWCRAQESDQQFVDQAVVDPAEWSLSGHNRWAPSVALLAAADALAERVRAQWERAAVDRQLIRPTPIPLRWHRSQRPVTGPVDDALAGPPTRSLPPRPGGTMMTSATLRGGTLAELFTVYNRLNSGRMVILGRAGAGKSGVAILLLLAALEQRRRLDDARRAEMPVPIMLTTHGWDPRRQRLADWFSRRLADDYPILRSSEFGPGAAGRLVREGFVALFLDGLDEMADDLRPVAIDAFNRLPASLRLVITARSAELVDATRGRHLQSAAAFELEPVPAGDAADYLRRCQPEPPPVPWKRLIDHLRQHPDSPLTSALDSPLSLTLIRDTFPEPEQLNELLAPGRFGSRYQVEDILIDRTIPVAYHQLPADPPTIHSTGKSQRLLGYLAAKMNQRNTRDLAWWRMHHWASPVPRILTGGLLGLLAGALVGAVVFGPVGQYAVVKGLTGTRFGTVYGAVLGLLFGLVVALVSEFREPRPGRANGLLAGALSSTRFNLAVGLLVGLAVGLAVGNQSHYGFGIPAGLLVGYAAGYAAARLPTGVGQASQSRWRTVRARIDIRIGCVAGLPVGLAYGLPKGLAHGVGAGLVSMFTVGLMIGFARPAAEVDNVTDPESSWRQARRRGTAFGLASGVPMGIGMGIANATDHGLLAGTVSAIGWGTLISLGGMVAISDTWRTTLTFIQLRRHGMPVHGMRLLKDAYDRGILRTTGPIYQFRHARLQDRLADKQALAQPADPPMRSYAPS